MSMRPREALDRLHEYTPGERRAGVLKLSSNENPLGPSPRAIEQLQQSAREAHIYPDGAAVVLRQRLAQHLSVPADQIITGNGSDELMVYAAAAFLNPGDVAITAQHTFSVYAFATNLFDGRVVTTKMPAGRHDPDAFLRALQTQPRTRLLFLCNPNNPTGTYLNLHEIEHLLRQTPPEVLVVLDEAYCEYMDAADAPDGTRLIQRYPNLLVLRTFSKLYGLAGLRVGYGMAQRQIIRALNKVKLPFNTSLIAQAAATAALDDDQFVRRSLDTNRRGRQRLYTELDRRGLRYYRTQANFICVNVDADCRAFAETMALNGVTIRPLASFGLDSWIRITIGSDEQIDALLEALDATLVSTDRHADAVAD